MSAMGPIERLDPELMRGQLLEAEHLARYRWAAALVEGKRVLDAGCGTGYGAELLARAGAGEVVGVDLDEEVIEAAKKAAAAAATYATADLRELPAELGDFDVVVCFEVLEHLDEPENALDRLVVALRPDGVLVVSSPNRDVYPPGNPYHKHEFRPDELAKALEARFTHVALVRQQDWLASGLFDDDELATLDALPVTVAKAVPGKPGKELYSVGLASSAPLPPVPPFVMLTRTTDLKWWQELLQGLRDELDAKNRHVRDLEGWVKQREAELQAASAELRAASAANTELHEVIRSMQATRVWQVGSAYWNLRDRLLRRRLG
jgi:SAM-dependent methyltransferase